MILRATGFGQPQRASPLKEGRCSLRGPWLGQASLHHLPETQAAFWFIGLACCPVQSRRHGHIPTHTDPVEVKVAKVYTGRWVLAIACFSEQLDRRAYIGGCASHIHHFSREYIAARHVVLIT